jgi:hypothetical protein
MNLTFLVAGGLARLDDFSELSDGLHLWPTIPRIKAVTLRSWAAHANSASVRLTVSDMVDRQVGVGNLSTDGLFFLYLSFINL